MKKSDQMGHPTASLCRHRRCGELWSPCSRMRYRSPLSPPHHALSAGRCREEYKPRPSAYPGLKRRHSDSVREERRLSVVTVSGRGPTNRANVSQISSVLLNSLVPSVRWPWSCGTIPVEVRSPVDIHRCRVCCMPRSTGRIATSG